MKISTAPVTTTDEPFATVFQVFQQRGLPVPLPVQLMTASKPLFDIYWQILQHYFSQQTLSPRLLGCIRYAVACRSQFAACVEMNEIILSQHGMTDLSALETQMPHPDLDETEASIFAFVLDALFYPNRISKSRIADMCLAGVPEIVLYEAAFHGAMLLMMGPLVNSLG